MEKEKEKSAIPQDPASDTKPAELEVVEDSDPAGDIVLPEEGDTLPFTGAKLS